MRDQEEGGSSFYETFDRGFTLLLKVRIANSEGLIDDQNLRVDMSHDRKAEPRVHSRRVCVEGSVDEVADIGKLDD